MAAIQAPQNAMAPAVKKYGPWGSSQCSTNSWSLKMNPGETMKQVMIRAGFIVDAIGFTAADDCGNITTKNSGGCGGGCHTITLAPSEYVTHISGTYGVYWHSGRCQIATLRIHTNTCPNGYGPYGQGKDVSNPCSFTSTHQPGFAVVGFFGGTSQYLDCIGVYVKAIQPQLKKCGPWGSQGPTNWRFNFDPSKPIREVIFRTGFIVDGIGFVLADNSGETRYFGGQEGSPSKLVLKSGEYMTHISGKHGLYEHDCQRHIASIKIHTNLRPNGYGPYGKAIDVSNVVSFSTTHESGSSIVGLFGKAGQYLDSIGAYVKKVSLVFGSELNDSSFHYCCVITHKGFKPDSVVVDYTAITSPTATPM